VRGWTTSDADAQLARRDGIEVGVDMADALVDAPLALIAVPVPAYPAVADAVVSAAPADAALLHASSLQSARALRSTGRVIGTHPLAGTHRVGFAAADAYMFIDCVVSVEARAPQGVRAAAEWLWRAAGARRFEYRSAEEHDSLMTWVSHLPQLASTALAHAIASAGVGPDSLGPGGRDATRLAASPFEMWAGILAAARPEAARALAALEQAVTALRSALEAGDMSSVERMWAAARTWTGPR